jgi:hypothetical protein
MRGKRLWLVICLTAAVLVAAGTSQAAIRKPYLKVYTGDVFVGGGFEQNGQCLNNNNITDNYHAAVFSGSSPTDNSKYQGGILAFNKRDNSNRPVGSTADFGVMALGLIENNTASEHGFTSGIVASSPNGLSFANSSNTGYFEGEYPQQHCIPDYFGTKQNNPAAWPGDVDKNTPSKQYKATAGGSPLVLSEDAIKLQARQRITLFVEGNLFIKKDITYNDKYKAFEIPQFTLVVRGNILIDKNVQTLDGWYIAQPNANNYADSGEIWTCHANSNGHPTAKWLYDNCRNETLRVNGAFTAKQINLTRLKGELADAKYNEQPTVYDSDCDCNNVNPNVAEAFVYTPETVLSGANFNETSTTSFTIKSLVSLPPVF